MRDFNEELINLSPVFPFEPNLIEQGTDEWHMMRLGVFTASNAKHLLSTKRGTKSTEYGTDYVIAPPSTLGRKTYMADLVANIAAPRIPDDIQAKPLAWGKDNEPLARDAYEALTFSNVGELPFIYKDSAMRVGASPDGITSTGTGLELKCPWSSSVYIQFTTQDKIKHEERHQCQFNMWVSGLDMWHVAKFDPRMINCKKLHMIEIKRDENAMKLFDEAILLFNAEMDLMLGQLGMKFGQQWEYFTKLVANKAA